MVWEKVLLNVSINPIAALAGLRNGELLEPGLFSSCMTVYREAAKVAQLERIEIPNEVEFEQRLRDVLEATANNECSMLQDIKEEDPIIALERKRAGHIDAHKAPTLGELSERLVRALSCEGEG